MTTIGKLFNLENGINVTTLEINEDKTEEFNLLVYRPSKTALGTILGYCRIGDVSKDKIFPKDTLFVSSNGEGSHSYSYVSAERFTMNTDVIALLPKEEMSVIQKNYYALCITKNRYRFSYGRKPKGIKLENLLVPNLQEIHNWVNDFELKKIETSVKSCNNNELVKSDWNWFELGKIFTFEQCKCSNAGDLLEEGDEIDYLGAKKTEGGFMDRVKHNLSLETKGNCIIFICDGQGSVGYTNYRKDDFIGSTTLSVGRNPLLNKYNALFLVTVLDLERYRYSFGRKYRKNLENTKIKLPSVKQSDNIYEPDWKYMENYIKLLSYGDCI